MNRETVSARVRLRALLDSLETSCWLIAADGRVLVRNAAAGRPPVWVVDARHDTSAAPEGAKIRALRLDDLDGTLVISPSEETFLGADFRARGLDELHVELAEHLVRGFSDPEIALLLGVPEDRVRVLVRETEKQLGVRDRDQLVLEAKRLRDHSAPPKRSRAESETVPVMPAITTDVSRRRRITR